MKNKKILMFGWELPPHNSGGLGIACYDLCEQLCLLGAQITFVLPREMDVDAPFMQLRYAQLSRPKNEIAGACQVYPKRNNQNMSESEFGQYESSLIAEVKSYAEAVKKIISETEFDIIHAHDWLSFSAGVEAKKISGKPLIVHIHSTEFDRAGGEFIYELVYKIEKAGLEMADRIIAVSQFTKDKIIKYYEIDSRKIEVVHNGVNFKRSKISNREIESLKRLGKKIILFVGRITIQKGPDYFLKAAKKVLEYNTDVIFIIVGTGDMEKQIIEQAATMGLSGKVLFTGFVKGDELNRLYRLADLYVMPSVSEPFGLVALESLVNRTPILISKQSGVAETVKHALKVDFWDTEEMANKIIAAISYRSLGETLSKKGSREVKKISWVQAAEKCARIYDETV